MANWKNALAAKNYTLENLGAAGQNGIKEYNELEQDLAELKSFEGQEGYDSKSVAAIEKELLRLDAKITKAIEMREAQLANIQKMQSARGKGKEPKVVVTPIQGTSQEQPKKEPQTPKIETQQAATVEEPKKESGDSFWGWVVGVAAVGFAAVVGVNVLKNR
jgi:predicted RNase H-like nuclease (RuvC/YqgF family)